MMMMPARGQATVNPPDPDSIGAASIHYGDSETSGKRTLYP
jgi:hypothetical protein